MKIKDYELYSIDKDGNVYGKYGRIMKPALTNVGYKFVNLSKDKKPKKFTIHRLVATAFIPNPDNLPQVNHKNGIKADNRVENLEWVSVKDNILHSYREGLISRVGSKNGRAILNEDKVRTIREELSKGVKVSQLATEYGIGIEVIYKINRRTTWCNI